MNQLPEKCWTVLKPSNELVLIKRGELGYSPQRKENIPWDAKNYDALNKKLGVTKAQEKAMVAGSMFGWDVPACDPSLYN